MVLYIVYLNGSVIEESEKNDLVDLANENLWLSKTRTFPLLRMSPDTEFRTPSVSRRTNIKLKYIIDGLCCFSGMVST